MADKKKDGPEYPARLLYCNRAAYNCPRRFCCLVLLVVAAPAKTGTCVTADPSEEETVGIMQSHQPRILKVPSNRHYHQKQTCWPDHSTHPSSCWRSEDHDSYHTLLCIAGALEELASIVAVVVDEAVYSAHLFWLRLALSKVADIVDGVTIGQVLHPRSMVLMDRVRRPE